MTLTGHACGISDLCIVDRGRNVVSVGRDGACKLWDVGESRCLSTFCKFDTIVNACSIQAVNNPDNAQALLVNSNEDQHIISKTIHYK